MDMEYQNFKHSDFLFNFSPPIINYLGFSSNISHGINSILTQHTVLGPYLESHDCMKIMFVKSRSP